MVEVYKFGGTSVGSAERMLAAAELVVSQGVARGELVVVASAMTKVTDALVSACAAAGRGLRQEAIEIIDGLQARHKEALKVLATDEDSAPVWEEVAGICAQLKELLGASALLGQLSARTRDRVLACGEKMSVRLVAVAMRRCGLDAVALDADVFVMTDGGFGSANPLYGVTERTIGAALRPHLDAGRLPIVTGFCGQAPDGGTTTMGRGGSDLSATLLASALEASKVTLWSDVDGVYSADPRVVPQARVIPQLNFREAAEMSYYGAKVLHQRTMIPVATLGIPVWSRNTMRPEAPGTVIDGRFTPGSHPVKAISAVRSHALVSVEGKGMAGVPGVAARVFKALASARINVTMISQSSSEASICFAVPQGDVAAAERALKRAFRAELSRGEVEEISVRRGVGLVAAVGLGMAHRPGIAGRVLDELGSARINILAIAQGSSELNISVAVDERDTDRALRAIHQGFGLHRLDTGVDTAQCLDLMLLGFGSIGRTLLELVLERQAYVLERFGLQMRVVAVSDRSGFIFEPLGLGAERLRALFEAKSRGGALANQAEATKGGSAAQMVKEAMRWRLSRPVLVDVSDSDDVQEAFEAALLAGADVVTANKKPLAGPWDSFQALAAASGQSGRLLKAEATVGAGLPVVDTLQMLMDTGDRVERVEGCLSGTLGFLMGRLEAGVRFSEAVREAVELGYTEPDPVADLCGADVGRKAVILGRLSGLLGEGAQVEVKGLVDEALSGMSMAALMEHLEAMDDDMGRQVTQAAQRGEVLRYVARVWPGRAEVGPVSVPKGSAAGMLSGTDNQILFVSDRYNTRPLVITGPGAGVEVTAMGVLGDVLRVAAERRL